MNDETTPREGTPEGPTPEEHVEDRTEERLEEPTTERAGELDLGRPEPESTQVLPQTQPTSQLPTLTPEAPEAPVASEPEGAPDSAAAPAAPMPAPAPTAASAAAPTPGGLVTVRTGPRPGAILLGLLCLLVAAYTTARQTLDWRLDLNLIGPISIGVLGALLLLVGLIGLVSRRRS